MKTILDGSRKLLVESLDIISWPNDIIVVGGWGPFIRHQNNHPGTKDVDLLFPFTYTKEDIAKVLIRFLDSGFFLSAKHEFQLCRAFQIGQRTYIYNVDLLHPIYGNFDKVDFIEVLDLDVSIDGIKVKTVNTINIQHGDIIYDERLFTESEVDGRKFNSLDASGIIISKINSCINKKRPRDIFDIYLSLNEQNVPKKLDHLMSINSVLGEELTKFNASFEKNWPFFKKSISEFDPSLEINKNLLSMSFLFQ